MSPPWSKPLEVDRLAEARAEVDFAIPLAELPGLRSARPEIGGEVHGRVSFGREQGFAAAQLSMRGVATLTCQRCMQPLPLPLETATRVALITSEAEASRVGDDLEPVLAEGGRISVGQLITEELLLMLPIVPLHEGDGNCASAPAATAETGLETHRPFARLGELLKR
ncbi:MAG TPA: DUF177 domain-containing protein [Steroidobacteraceae bacterium]|nr:DUF177 domain-containing protein [Steroidobacteraceae bacterium]